jgi:hypothetical protein
VTSFIAFMGTFAAIIELPTVGVAAHRVEGGPLVPALGAADAVVLINPGYLAAHPLGDLANLSPSRQRKEPRKRA